MTDLLLRSLNHCLIPHSIIGDMTFPYCNMDWSSFIPLSYCLTLYLLTHFQIFIPLFIHFLHIDTRFLIRYLIHIIHMFHWWFDHSSFLSFHPWHFLWLPLGPWLMRFFYALHLVHEGTGLIIGYLSLVSLHFFHPITLTYVMSRVLRPPWGHEIRRYLWQSSLGQAFVDWSKYSHYHVLFYGRYFWKNLVSLLLDIMMFDGFLGLETVHWGYWIHPLVVH